MQPLLIWHWFVFIFACFLNYCHKTLYQCLNLLSYHNANIFICFLLQMNHFSNSPTPSAVSSFQRSNVKNACCMSANRPTITHLLLFPLLMRALLHGTLQLPIPTCMFCCEWGSMREDKDNPLALLSKRSPQNQTDYRRKLERLQADLEAEKIQTLWACGQLGAELRRLRKEAEREHRRTVRDLAARRCRSGHLPAKEGQIKNRGLHNKLQTTGETGRGPSKLEELLLTLYEKINGKQAGYKFHHGREFELEKSIFLCRLLEAHGRLLQGTRRLTPPRYVAEKLSKKPVWDNGSDPSRTTQLLARCRVQLRTSQRDLSSDSRKSKPDQKKRFSSCGLHTAGPCTATALRAASQLYNPRNTIHAVQDNHPSQCAESSSSAESSLTICTKGNMEVSSWTFLH